jgi:purine-nucleoside phosphorylase
MSKRADLGTRLSYGLAWVRGKLDAPPAVGLVLGSGLSAFAERLESATTIPYGEIPGFPVSRVPGHPGRMVIGELAGAEGRVSVAAMLGRVHAYEGWPAEDVAFGARVLCALGVKVLALTNAAGAVNPDLAPGDLVRITDHLNLSGQNPLVGDNDERIGTRFPDMSHAYDPRLGDLLDATAADLGIALRRGVYACMLGPSYETPAEVRMLRTLGADLVGMSTVPEVIVARHMGVPAVAVSVVTNLASGLSTRPLSHGEVAETADRVRDRIGALLAAFLTRAAR